MRAQEFVTEVTIDNRRGAGSVPWNQEVDYRGLRVAMKPSTFLRLALPLTDQDNSSMERHIGTGGTIGAPFLDIVVPEAWQSGDFSEPAQVKGHDGRHRMQAISKLEGDAPVETHLFPKYLRNRDLTPEIIKHLQAGMVTQSGRYLAGPLFDVNTGLAEGLTEVRDSLFAFVKRHFPTWPDYVLKDFLYAQAKGIRDQAELDDFLKRNKQDYGNCKWTLIKLHITLDIFTPKTQREIARREGGSSNPNQVPRDAERHALQSQMIQQKGVSAEPIIVAKLANGYDLIEGWHRTIQNLKAFPQGYTGPAWVCTGATYKSEIVKQGVVEDFADGKGPGRPGDSIRHGIPKHATMAELEKASHAKGRKGQLARWQLNMRRGHKK